MMLVWQPGGALDC